MQQKIAKRIPDEIVYLDKSTETGKVIKSDTSKFLFRKYDGSTREIKWKLIDTIDGHSCFTTFVSPGLGYHHVPYYSTFDYANNKLNGVGLNIKYGKMKFRHQASYISILLLPSNYYTIFKLGAGYNYYLIDYTKPLNCYVGSRTELNLVDHNKTPHINLRAGVGAEYLLFGFIRLFGEADVQRNIFNVNHKLGFTMNFGLRISREYKAYYQRLNYWKRL